MSHFDAVVALRQKIRDSGVVIDADMDGGGVARTAKSLGNVHFVTKENGGDVAVVMSANRSVVHVAFRPNSLDRYDRVAMSGAILRTVQEAESVLQDALASLKEVRLCI